MKRLLIFAIVLIWLHPILSTVKADIIHIPLPDMGGTYNNETAPIPMPLANPIFPTLSMIQKIQLHVEGTHTLGQAEYAELIELDGVSQWWYWTAPLGLTTGAILKDFDPGYLAVSEGGPYTTGSFDVTEDFSCYFVPPNSELPLPSWDDYISDGFLDLYIGFGWDTNGNPPPLSVIVEPEINITHAELIITTIPEPCTLLLVGLGGLALRQRR